MQVALMFTGVEFAALSVLITGPPGLGLVLLAMKIAAAVACATGLRSTVIPHPGRRDSYAGSQMSTLAAVITALRQGALMPWHLHTILEHTSATARVPRKCQSTSARLAYYAQGVTPRPSPGAPFALATYCHRPCEMALVPVHQWHSMYVQLSRYRAWERRTAFHYVLKYDSKRGDAEDTDVTDIR